MLLTHPTRSAYTQMAFQRRAIAICSVHCGSCALQRAHEQRTNQPTRMNPERIRMAIAGDPGALTELLGIATPVVQARVARALLRRPDARGRDIRSDVADLTQEVFVALFTADGKALKAWDPARGLSFANFVGLLAQRRVSSLLRSRSHERTESLDQEVANDVVAGSPLPEAVASSREILSQLLERLQAQLSARGMELFERLFVAQESVEEVCGHMGLTANAVHQWRRRLGQAAEAALREIKAEQPSKPAYPAAAHTAVAMSGVKLRRGT
jgi:RNA polymerase sigma factor (sigma-70 family)